MKIDKETSEEDIQSQYQLAVARLKGLRILLVEDDSLNRKVIEAFLQVNEVIVESAENGQLAVEMVQQNSFDCVLMDCQMPVMDGYAATLRIRQLPGLEQLPIIALTGNAMDADIERAIDAGMNDYILKPVDIRKMHITISKNIN